MGRRLSVCTTRVRLAQGASQVWPRVVGLAQGASQVWPRVLGLVAQGPKATQALCNSCPPQLCQEVGGLAQQDSDVERAACRCTLCAGLNGKGNREGRGELDNQRVQGREGKFFFPASHKCSRTRTPCRKSTSGKTKGHVCPYTPVQGKILQEM